MPDPGELLELTMGQIGGEGSCVARAPDGRVVFVRHTLPGERVRARVTSTTAKLVRADAVEILAASPDRVTPPCPSAGPDRCGGCDFAHVALAAQRDLKARRVGEQLRRLGRIEREVTVEAVPGDETGLGWRTRIRLHADGAGRLGYRRYRSHQVEAVTGCPVASAATLGTGVLDGHWDGFDEVEVVTGPGSDEAVIVATGPATAPVPDGVDAGLVIGGRTVRPPSAVHARVAGFTFRISPGVFWQVHAGAADLLLRAVLAAARPEAGESVVDLYAGAGLFAVPLAARVGPSGSVLAVERARDACADAVHNAKGMRQLRVRRASVTPHLVAHDIGAPSLIVLDPARPGVGPKTMAALAEHAAPAARIVYVSCDAASFARDARALLDAHWQLTSLRAFDIFPMTEHVELVARFDPAPA